MVASLSIEKLLRIFAIRRYPNMGKVVNIKPLIQVHGSSNFKYKNTFMAYIFGDIPLLFDTDLTQEQFNKFINGEYSLWEIKELQKSI